MNDFFHGVLVAMFVLYMLSIPLTIAQIDRPRKPITRGAAAVIVFLNILFGTAIVYTSLNG